MKGYKMAKVFLNELSRLGLQMSYYSDPYYMNVNTHTIQACNFDVITPYADATQPQKSAYHALQAFYTKSINESAIQNTTKIPLFTPNLPGAFASAAFPVATAPPPPFPPPIPGELIPVSTARLEGAVSSPPTPPIIVSHATVIPSTTSPLAPALTVSPSITVSFPPTAIVKVVLPCSNKTTSPVPRGSGSSIAVHTVPSFAVKIAAVSRLAVAVMVRKGSKLRPTSTPPGTAEIAWPEIVAAGPLTDRVVRMPEGPTMTSVPGCEGRA
ncbi:hypothetical protein EV356DRAFT_95467 [Viridothelium virens]|uniref:Uncharacterized protein n=1 Tax=Viridothelium virens TaxID=1048519 RepID=A0A6A6HE37_VIRVR|nr:hypothetical protein EV356DRAFT_95467 [Viridothelium virens]